MSKLALLLFTSIVALTIIGCISTDNKVDAKVETVHEIKPVHITVDLNIRVQNALDDFFKDVDETSDAASTESVK